MTGSRLTVGLLLLALTLAVSNRLGGQAPRRSERRQRTSAGSVDPLAVRAEYASALIQARRYREAAAEYRRLLQQQPNNFEWRLNYARALAWSGAHRAAEVELRSLAARAPRNATVEELLRSVRESIEPTVREATAWVAERPGYTPYRLALARAYVRERRPRMAFRHFDIVVQRDPSPALLAEAADARAAAGDRAGAVDLYRRAVARAPSNVQLRQSYARTLAANRQYAAAIEQYDLLVASTSDVALLTERGEVQLRRGDTEAAERDLLASIARRPTRDAYLLLGDMYRWGGQFKGARDAYEKALALRPEERLLRRRLAQLTREERPGFGYASLLDEDLGVTVDGGATTDNAGFVYAASGARVGFPFGRGTVLGLGAEPRIVYERIARGVAGDSGDADVRLVGAAGSLGLAHTFHGEEVDARIAGRGGAVGHSSAPAVPLFAAGAVVTYRGAWSLSVEAAGGPAYDNLMAVGIADDPSLGPTSGSGVTLLTSQTFAVGVTVPFGVADLAAAHESMSLSDGNRRSVFQASVRVPLVSHLSLLYSASSLGFAERSALYWDPPRYLSHEAGLELGVRTDEGLALTARVLPGVGRAVEGLTPGDPTRFGETQPGVARYVGQLAASVDLSVRRRHWETAFAAEFGTGRSGGYRRFDGGFLVRYIP
ncbi:MAG: tetratricopeptide repeat protein [Gemmatimonadaceae bacterium]